MSRALIIGGFTPSLVNFRASLLQALVAEGVDLTAAAAEEQNAVTQRLKAWRVSFEPLPLARAGLNPLRDRSYFQALKRLLDRSRPELILAYTHKPVIYTALAVGAAQPRPRMFPLITGLGYAFIGQGLKAVLARWALCFLYRRASRNFTGVIFQNGDDLAVFRRLRLIQPETPVCIVRGSGIDLAEFPTQLLELKKPIYRTKFLLIARLLGDKGIREYVDAAQIIKAQYPNAEFHLVGPTDPNPAAIPLAEVKDWQREGVITYHGAQTDVRPFLSDCTVYVLPSYREGTPRTVLEAMATGRAVVTTDAPGCRETIFDAGPTDVEGIRTGENGMMVPVKSVDALAGAMLRLIENSEMIVEMGRAGRRLAEQHYDVHKVNQQMLEFMGLGSGSK